jgi:hypothetical protein
MKSENKYWKGGCEIYCEQLREKKGKQELVENELNQAVECFHRMKCAFEREDFSSHVIPIKKYEYHQISQIRIFCDITKYSPNSPLANAASTMLV